MTDLLSAQVFARVEARANHDAEFARVLASLVDAPTNAAGEFTHVAANRLNQQRRRDALERFRQDARSTADVQQLLNLGTPQAVHRLRTRGKIIGRPIGNATWFPAWQFDGGQLRAELAEILRLLSYFTNDTVAADRIMRLTRDDLGGRSVADALDRPATADQAWAVLAELAS